MVFSGIVILGYCPLQENITEFHTFQPTRSALGLLSYTLSIYTSTCSICSTHYAVGNLVGPIHYVLLSRSPHSLHSLGTLYQVFAFI